MQAHRIGVIGGTGPQGRGLGYRFALAGHQVVLGSRSAERAAQTAEELTRALDGRAVVGSANNTEAAQTGDVVLLAVPYDGHRELVESLRPALAGKVVISCVNPLGFDRSGPHGLDVPEGSVAEQAAGLLPDSHVVAAFHHVAAAHLMEPATGHHEDVLVCGDDPQAKAVVIDLAEAVAGRPGVDAGPLRVARYLEPFTSVLIRINKRYRTQAGILVTGLPER